MKLKIGLTCLAAALSAGAFAANTATVNVTASVNAAAEITGAPSSVDFGALDASAVQGGTVPTITSNNVDVFDNDPTKGMSIQTNCAKNASGNGCYICQGTGADCTVANERVLVQCTYNSCAPAQGTATSFQVTPNATQADPFTSGTTITSANATQSACSATPGSLVCGLAATSQLPKTGSYTGAMTFTVQSV